MCPVRTRTLRLRRNCITRVRSALPGYLQRCYAWFGPPPNSLFVRASKLRALQRAPRSTTLPLPRRVQQDYVSVVAVCGAGFRRSHAHVSAVQQHNRNISWRKQVHSRGGLTTQKTSRSAPNIFAPPSLYSNARPARKDGAEFPRSPQTGSPISTEHKGHPSHETSKSSPASALSRDAQG